MAHRHDQSDKCYECGGIIFLEPVERNSEKYHERCIEEKKWGLVP